MRREPDAARFRALFSKLRDEDRRAAPDFDGVWRSSLQRCCKSPPRARPAWQAAAAALALATIGGLAALLVPSARRGWVSIGPTKQIAALPATRTATAAEPASSLADWRSPTEFLLELAADETASPSPDRAAEPIPAHQNF